MRVEQPGGHLHFRPVDAADERDDVTAAMLHTQDGTRERSAAPAFRLAAVIGLHMALLAWLAHAPPESPPAVKTRPMDVRIVTTFPSVPPPVEPSKAVAQPPKPQPSTMTRVRAAPQPNPNPNPNPLLTAHPESRSVAQAKHEAPAAPSPPAQPAMAMTPARFDAEYLQNPAPAYPSISKRMHEEGTVLLLVLVSSDGEAERVGIRQGSGYARLDEVAVKTVQRWRFVPARRGNEAVAASIVVPIVFRLDG